MFLLLGIMFGLNMFMKFQENSEWFIGVCIWNIWVDFYVSFIDEVCGYLIYNVDICVVNGLIQLGFYFEDMKMYFFFDF